MGKAEEVEERPVSTAELKAGITAKAGHRLVLIVGGVAKPKPVDDAPPEGGPEGEFNPDDPPPPAGGDAGDTPAPAEQPPQPGEDVPPDEPPPPVEVPGELEFQLVSVNGVPQANAEVELALPDGTKRAGRTNAEGRFKLDGLPPKGDCKLDVPDVTAPAEAAPASAPGRVRYQPGLPLAIGTKPVVELPPRVRRGRLTGMHFETNKTFLRPSAMAGIRQLRALYESFGAMSLLVSGHTDTVGAADYNRGLSLERADSIAQYLTDQADQWLENYGPRPHSGAWGVREDQYMLATLPQGGEPFYAGAIDGKAGSGTSGAYKKFQASKGLPESGAGDKATRRALIADYMALDGTSLPQGTVALTHGCGFTHLEEQTGPNVEREANRRVEMFLFEGDVAPAPQSPCPGGGCAEYPQWLAQAGLTVDLDKPAGSVAVTVVDEATGAPVDDANVHAAGPTPHDAPTASGVATLKDLVAGHYKLIVDHEGFEAADAEVDVESGAEAAVTMKLKARPPMEIELFEGRALRPEDIAKFKPVEA